MFRETVITVQFVADGIELREITRIVSFFIREIMVSLACIFEDLYLFGSRDAYGLTICAPVHSLDQTFLGAYCADVIPTSYSPDQNSYL